MITLRRSAERGHANHGWLDSRHTFSFADYFDPEHIHFRALRVINEDRVAPGRGFGTHAHQNMEIVTYVLQGALQHEDSMGTGSVIHPGDVQRMTAGTGVTHSELNASRTEPVHFLQIWIIPERQGLPPSYEQKTFSADEKRGKLRLVASRDGREGSVVVHQDVNLSAARLGRDQVIEWPIPTGRFVWVHVARGRARVADHTLEAGDAAALEGERALRLEGLEGDEEAELLVFDLR